MKKLSKFSKLCEADRMIYIARVNHAIWYSEEFFNKVNALLNEHEHDMPEAVYFPTHKTQEDETTSN